MIQSENRSKVQEMQRELVKILNTDNKKQYLANIAAENQCNVVSLPHLTASINNKKQLSKDNLLRIAAFSNSLIDASILNSKSG